MTCKDCKNRRTCTEPNKSYKYDKDGNSWANWCDDFDTIHKDKTMVKDGFQITQSGYNFYVWVRDEKTGELMSHFVCQKQLSERELGEYADYVKGVLPELERLKEEMKCKDCYHYEVCKLWDIWKEPYADGYSHCMNYSKFKHKSQIIELRMEATDRLKEELTKYCFERCVDEL